MSLYLDIFWESIGVLNNTEHFVKDGQFSHEKCKPNSIFQISLDGIYTGFNVHKNFRMNILLYIIDELILHPIYILDDHHDHEVYTAQKLVWKFIKTSCVLYCVLMCCY